MDGRILTLSQAAGKLGAPEIPPGQVPRLALRPEQAADSIGVGRTFFFEQVLPELRVVRRGRLRLIPVTELGRWLERNAAKALE